MKPSPISTAMLLVSLFLIPAVLAQSPDSASQSAASPGSAAEVPRLIKFSGTLLDAQDRPMAGPVGVTFALHAQQSGGAALWIETQNVTPDAHGNYTVLLGANSAHGVPAELFSSGEARWLEVQVERQTEQPRVLLVSVPYALKAADAETVGGHSVSDFVLSAPATTTVDRSSSTAGRTGTGKAAAKAASSATPAAAIGSMAVFTSGGSLNFLPKWLSDGQTLSGKSLLFDSGAGVGIGTTSPAEALDVNGNFFLSNGGGTNFLKSEVNLALSADPFHRHSPPFQNIIFQTGGMERVRISGNGLLGIGTANPTRTLDVNGEIRVAGGNIFLQRNLTDLAERRNWAWGTETFNVGDVSLFVSASNITAPSLPVFTALSNGNMGVGLATPAQKLSVAGTIQSTSGGFKFPDGTTQTTAALFKSATSSGVLVATSGVTNLLTLSINAPAAGYVYGAATGYCNLNVTTAAEWRYVIGTSATEGWSFPLPVYRFGGAVNESAFPISVDRVFPVVAGTNTFYANFDAAGGLSAGGCQVRLTLFFTPSQLP